MPDEKINVTWEDINSRKVETRLKEQQAVARNRAYAQLKAESVPDLPPARRPNIFYNSAVYMTLFGLLGGLLAWGCGTLLQFKPSARGEAEGLVADMAKLSIAPETSRVDSAEAQVAIDQIRDQGRHNPYFAVLTDPSLSNAARQQRIEEISAHDRSKEFIADVLAFGVCGVMIAMCLGIAEPLTQRNYPGAVVNGSVGAMLGLVGGVVVALFVGRLHQFVLNASGLSAWKEIFAQTASWGVLGLFLTLGPGVVMRNRKKLLIGLLGGLIGGLIGGAVYEPLRAATHDQQASRFVALIAIAVIAGVGTGLMEDAAKSGWVRVIAGAIAGKQFILYRNPTFIGSSPDCQIYLFKDPKVGSRHAAIHIVPGGFELENLPLGSGTLVNDKPVNRARLRHGDRVGIGLTMFLFQEKTRARAKEV